MGCEKNGNLDGFFASRALNQKEKLKISNTKDLSVHSGISERRIKAEEKN
jgi:hypothetical protein